MGDSDVGDSSGFYALCILMALVVDTWDKLERNSTYPVTRARRLDGEGPRFQLAL